MTRVLVVWGESRGHQNVFAALSRADCSPLPAYDLAPASEMLADESPDLVTVDLGLRPPGDSEMVEFLEACHSASPSVPTLALVPSGDPDQYEGFLDVDDFVLAPYRPGEVVMRIHHLLKRFQRTDESSVIKTASLTIDLGRYEAMLDGRRLDLTFKEYELLRFLAATPGKVFTRETLLNRVWGYDYFGGTRTVDVHIRRLRSKIETTTTTFIETVRNVGYRFKEF